VILLRKTCDINRGPPLGETSPGLICRPAGAGLFPAFYPRLAPWAAFLRRFAAVADKFHVRSVSGPFQMQGVQLSKILCNLALRAPALSHTTRKNGAPNVRSVASFKGLGHPADVQKSGSTFKLP